jgi:hypothetical protein
VSIESRIPKSDRVEEWRQKLDGRADLERRDKEGKTFRIIAAEHFSRQAAEYIESIAREEIKNPREWLFLIEGGEVSGIYECEIAKRIAKKLNIPIHDPIFEYYSDPEIIELYFSLPEDVIQQKESKEIVYGQILISLISYHPNPTNALESVANRFGLEPQEVISYMQKAVEEKNKNEYVYLQRMEQLRKNLLYISNAISAQVLHYYLKKYPDRNNVLLYLGLDHKGILDIDINKIPESLKLNDEQIGRLLEKRGERRKSREIEKKNRERGNRSKVEQILSKIPGISDNLREILLKWSDNIFGLDYIREIGYEEYLNSPISLHQLWGAAALLADMVDRAKLEGRALTPEELDEARNAFIKASESRKKDYSEEEGEEIRILAENLHIVAEIMKRWGS